MIDDNGTCEVIKIRGVPSVSSKKTMSSDYHSKEKNSGKLQKMTGTLF